MAYEIENDIAPLSLINGFLEAGKTRFLDFTMRQDYFRAEGKTFLTVCEEGDTGYDERKLKGSKVIVVFVGDMRELTPQYLNELEVAYQSKHVLMEWNGMWGQNDLKLPDDWIIHQQITIIDGSTFESYVQNMKPFLGVMLRGSELIIVNRCDGIPDDELTVYRRTVHTMNRESEIILEDKEEETEQAALEEDFPYDLGADVVGIKPEDYGIWHIDCMNQPGCYKDEVVKFTVMVFRSPEFPKGQFVSDRIIMTCCRVGMAFLGFICERPGAEDYKTKQQVKVRARMGTEYQKNYHGEGSILYAEHVGRAEETKNVVQFQE